MIPLSKGAEVSLKPLRTLICLTVLALLTLSLGACATSGAASTGTAGDEVATTGDRGVVSDTDETTKRRMRVLIQFPDFRETVDMLEGQKVTYTQPDGTYVIVPRVSKTEVGRVEVDVERQSPAGTEQASAIFFLKEPYFFHLEFENLDWPTLTVEVLNVHPPLRPGLR